MRNVLRFVTSVLLVLAVASLAAADITGTLVDRHCSAKVVKEGQAALRASQKKNDLRVQVSGQVSGDTTKVATLKLLP